MRSFKILFLVDLKYATALLCIIIGVRKLILPRKTCVFKIWYVSLFPIYDTSHYEFDVIFYHLIFYQLFITHFGNVSFAYLCYPTIKPDLKLFEKSVEAMICKRFLIKAPPSFTDTASNSL